MSAIAGLFKRPSRPTKPTPIINEPPIIIHPPSEPSALDGQPRLIWTGCNPIGMSYWNNINNHSGRDTFLIFLSISDIIHIFTISKQTLTVIESKVTSIVHTGEGCYFSKRMHDILYIPLVNELIRYNIYTGDMSVAWRLDSSERIWQPHTSWNDEVHSATVKDSNYREKSWATSHPRYGTEYFDIAGKPDECQIDKDGNYLFIKEDDYNRIINIENDGQEIITNAQGALGHSDCGFNEAYGENDMSNLGGALDRISFSSLERTPIFSTGVWNMGYFSFCNAAPQNGRIQKGLITTPTELISVILDGSGNGKIICPNLTQSNQYEHRAKANLCPLGEYAAWTAFVDGSLNCYVVKVP